MHIICKNCGNHFTGKFCPQCGQTISVHRITIKHVLEEFWHNFTHTDKNYFSFAWILFKNPGTVIQEYLDGKRSKYFSPYTFYLVTTSLLVLTTKSVFHLEDKLYHINNEFGYYVDSNINIIMLCILPFLAFIFQAFYRDKQLNYAESFTALIMIFGLMNFFLLITNLLSFIFIQYHYYTRGLVNIIGYFFILWAIIKFTKPKKFANIFKPSIVTIIFFVSIEFIGKGIALLLWGLPFQNLIHAFY